MRAITLRSRLLTKALGAFSRSGVESATEVGQRPTPPPLRVRPRLPWGCLRGRTLRQSPRCPTMPLRPCRTPRCDGTAIRGYPRCSECADRNPGRWDTQTIQAQPWRQAYREPAYRAARTEALRLRPECPCGQPATQTDHVVPLRQLWDTDEWSTRHQIANIQTLCARCHQIKTNQDRRR